MSVLKVANDSDFWERCHHRHAEDGARYLAAEDVAFLEAVASDGTTPDHGVDAADADRLGGDQHLPVSGTRVMANDGIRATSPAARVAAFRRFAALAIHAFRASPEASALPPTPV